ncbi:MAG: septum formation inhibitor Maf [Oscillospiraceae bacterium]|jgi:septum formation protein|nr:septum formation inhibitor Maf [Oscillospiraceae bacterium]
MGIVLASASPRRKELLERMGLDFTVRVAPLDETIDPFSNPADEAARVASEKARSVYPYCHDGDIIIGADTIVVCDSLVMGKPRSEADAFSMLRRLSGREHQVMTGLSVLTDTYEETVTVTTTLRMRHLSDEEIRAYIATGEPMDKAGAYGIQGLASMFVVGLDGDYYNVMGLPICTLAMILRKCGVKLLNC